VPSEFHIQEASNPNILVLDKAGPSQDCISCFECDSAEEIPILFAWLLKQLAIE